MEFWTQMMEQFKKIWAGFKSWQKITIIGVLAVAIAGTVLFILSNSNPKMDALYTDLDAQDAGKIVAKLNEKKISYKIADEGKTILVPEDDKYQLRLELAQEIDLSGVVGFESFNETRFGETDTDKRVRFLVALQGELTRTIEELDEVESAKVHIAMPSPSLFIREEKEPTASVLLRLKPYSTLKPQQVKTIVSFVSTSVESLKPENVTIMDVYGNLLSEGINDDNNGLLQLSKISTDQLTIKQKYEKELARSIQSMLEPMFGVGKVVVRANVTMDFAQVETKSETYGNSVLTSEQSREETSKGTTPATGGNPADANMGTPSYGNISGSSGNNEYELTEKTRNYEVDKIVETKIGTPGKITHVTLSVLIDGDITDEQKDDIAKAASMAAGIDVSRGDQIAVVNMPFNNNANEIIDNGNNQSTNNDSMTLYIKYGVIALVVLILIAGIVVFILRRKRSQKEKEMAIAIQKQNEEKEEEFELESIVEPEAQEKKNIRQQVEKLTQSNPEEVANVLRTWLIEE